jgi:hypothetical protein
MKQKGDKGTNRITKKSFLLLTDNRLIFLFYSKDILSKVFPEDHFCSVEQKV